MIRKPPEFLRFKARLVGFPHDKAGVIKADVIYDARDLDAAIELLVVRHREFCRQSSNPDTLFHVQEILLIERL